MAATAKAEQPPKEVPVNERFFRSFQHEVSDIQEQMERLESRGTSGGERADAVDHCLASIARLSNEVKDASSYLPAYDQRTYGDAIKALSNKLQELRTSFAPRQKFSFKSGSSMFKAKKNDSALNLNDAAELASERQRHTGVVPDMSNESSLLTTPAESRSPATELDDKESERGLAEIPSTEDLSRIRQPSFSQSTSIAIGPHDGVHIILPSSAAHATSSGTLSMLHHCIVDMSTPTSIGTPFAGLTLKNIKESLIVCGHVNGAAHLTKVSNSVIVVASRQFRMHESHNCDVYLLTTSRPIIEDCSGIRFAPLPETYMTESDRQVDNQWQQVDDFKWLRSEPSPNWSVLEASRRIEAQVWNDVVPGGPQLGTEEILKAVHISG
ncbi:hypothetical protein LTR37_011680 [Vermiconidia calcicola]|uniref:Uncharacterized protein n=1 Tax=Vermiconidia calcicola TaxID=1690605 RepID=A0ACC3N252_9PEZI|nr:hypothetical protein LTR37_011680 [Vermiconidia calcicola]